MRIAIVSDTHDNLANLKKILNWLKENKIAALIHCGDVFRKETVKFIYQNFKGKIFISLADVDDDNINDLPRIKCWKDFGKVEIGSKKVAFSHLPKTALDLALSQKYDIVFYGHLHKPWETKIRKTKLVNPGNAAGIFFKPTFAVYDTKINKLELKILEKLS